MKIPRLVWFILWLSLTLISPGQGAVASAYNAHPKLIVVIVIDQFRADYLERYRDQFGEGGFRLFLERGAYFTDCNYDYANTRTAPGHATLLTGSYTSGHGIISNEWWDPEKQKRVTSVEDDNTKFVGINRDGAAASPHNLLSDTLGDELKLATGGKSRVFAVSLKDRAAVLPAGFSGDAAYWIDPKSGDWISSTYYLKGVPQWVSNFNGGHRADKFWNREWRDGNGQLLGSTAHASAKDGSPLGFYEVVGSTPFANEYQLEFAKELILYEKLGAGAFPTTDLLVISLSANDLVGHAYGPDTPQMRSMALALDRQLEEFFGFLGHQIGMANIWMALSADHGIAPLPDFARTLRLPAANLDVKSLRDEINARLAKKYAKKGEYVLAIDYPLAWLNAEAFAGTPGGKEKDESVAEADVGEAMKQLGWPGYFTKSQLARGETPPTELGRRYAHSYSPEGGWYVMGIPALFNVGVKTGTDHATPFTYDTHVPLAFYGLAFQTGIYRTHAEPVDLAVTFASLLGINAPAKATGRVLTEALPPPHPAFPPPDAIPSPPSSPRGGSQ